MKKSLLLCTALLSTALVSSIANATTYERHGGSYTWNSSPVDYKGRLIDINMSATNPTEMLNSRMELIVDNSSGDKLFATYYPKVFKDPKQIKSVIVENLSISENIPFGISLKKEMEDGISSALYVFPDGSVNEKYRTSKYKSVQDIVFASNLTDKCGVLNVDALNTNKPLTCSATGESYSFSDFDNSKIVGSYDLTPYVKKGLIPYVFYIQSKDGNPVKLNVKFKIEYND